MPKFCFLCLEDVIKLWELIQEGVCKGLMVHYRENTLRDSDCEDHSIVDDTILSARQTGTTYISKINCKILSTKDIRKSLLESISHPPSESLRVRMVASTKHLPSRPRSKVSNKAMIWLVFRHNNSRRTVATTAIMKIPSIGTPSESVCSGVHRVSSSRTARVLHPGRDPSNYFSSTTPDVAVFMA